MNRTEKNQKRSVIAKTMDINNTRLKDSEVDKLFDFVTKPEDYNGKSKTRRTWRQDWDHDGKYERETVNQYTLKSDTESAGVHIHSETYDDGGLTYSGDSFVNKAREVLKLLDYFI